MSGAVLISAGIAGRLTNKVSPRFLIGGGFLLVGVGLVLMRNTASSSPWTHLIPGFIVAGVGAGLVNTPLASVAVGVVEPRRAGMASGINSTLRQVGIAAGVAAVGSIFASHIRTTLTSDLAGTPAAAHASQLAAATSAGRVSVAVAHVPAAARAHVSFLATNAFVSSLNDILLITASVAFFGAAAALVLIRRSDLHESAVADGESWSEPQPADEAWSEATSA